MIKEARSTNSEFNIETYQEQIQELLVKWSNEDRKGVSNWGEESVQYRENAKILWQEIINITAAGLLVCPDGERAKVLEHPLQYLGLRNNKRNDLLRDVAIRVVELIK